MCLFQNLHELSVYTAGRHGYTGASHLYNDSPTEGVMSKEEIDRIVGLRTDLIGFHKHQLNGKNEPSAIIKQADVVVEIEKAIRTLDALLKDYVTFN